MRDIGKLRRNRRHEGVLPARDPQRDGLAQGVGPVLGLGDHVGGVVEDPATGAAAAAFGAYLRSEGLITPPATITVHQGVDMGRPSLLTIEVDPDASEIRVSGRAVAM